MKIEQRYKVITQGLDYVVIDTKENDKEIRSFNQMSDDWAITNANNYCKELNNNDNY